MQFHWFFRWVKATEDIGRTVMVPGIADSAEDLDAFCAGLCLLCLFRGELFFLDTK